MFEHAHHNLIPPMKNGFLKRGVREHLLRVQPQDRASLAQRTTHCPHWPGSDQQPELLKSRVSILTVSI